MNIKNRVAFIVSSLLRKKVILIGLPLLLLFIGIVFVGLVRFGIIEDPFPLQNISFFSKEPKVSIKTEYKNPFHKKTQYVNPFDAYKNPFIVAK